MSHFRGATWSSGDTVGLVCRSVPGSTPGGDNRRTRGLPSIPRQRSRPARRGRRDATARFVSMVTAEHRSPREGRQKVAPGKRQRSRGIAVRPHQISAPRMGARLGHGPGSGAATVPEVFRPFGAMFGGAGPCPRAALRSGPGLPSSTPLGSESAKVSEGAGSAGSAGCPPRPSPGTPTSPSATFLVPKLERSGAWERTCPRSSSFAAPTA